MIIVDCPLSVPIAFGAGSDGVERMVCATTSLRDVLMVHPRLPHEDQNFALTTIDRETWALATAAPNAVLRAVFAAYGDKVTPPLSMTYKSDIDVLVRHPYGHGLLICALHAIAAATNGAAARPAVHAAEDILLHLPGDTQDWWGGVSERGGLQLVERRTATPTAALTYQDMGTGLQGHQLALFHLTNVGSSPAPIIATSVDPSRIWDALLATPLRRSEAIAAAFGGQIRANPLAEAAGFRVANLMRRARANGWLGGTAFTLSGQPFLLLSAASAKASGVALQSEAIWIADVRIDAARAGVLGSGSGVA